MKAKDINKQLLAKITFHTAAIAQHRDALRAVVDEAEEVLGSLDEGVIALESAVDTLSQLL